MSEPIVITPEELASWRSLPLTQRWLEWLRWRIDVYRQNIPEYIIKDKLDEARAASGALKGYEEILNAVMEEGKPPATVEEDDYAGDPAARPKRETHARS